MTIDALLYLDAELSVDDLASLARDWRRRRGSRRQPQISRPQVTSGIPGPLLG